jgi:hypothetical protein
VIIDTHLHWPMSGDLDARPLVEVMDAMNIDGAVVCGLEVLFAPTSAPARHWNDRLMAFCAHNPARLTPLVSVHLSQGQSAIDEARRCIEAGPISGFKLHPWLQGESLRLPATSELCELAGERALPLMLHDGTPPYALCSQVAMLACEHPRTTFILGHSGLLHYWREAAEVGSRFDNVYLTLCGGHPWGMGRICRLVPAERLLWGSDCLGPGNEEIIGYRLGLVDLLELDPYVREAIMNGNARRLWRSLIGRSGQ